MVATMVRWRLAVMLWPPCNQVTNKNWQLAVLFNAGGFNSVATND
jgi:hypothetical protein